MTETDQMRLLEARESFTGRSLTASQFDEAWAMAGIMHREIVKSGSFKEKLGDMAYAMARSERFDAVKGETIIRDIYKGRYAETMNETREALMAREAPLRGDGRARNDALKDGLQHARSVLEDIQAGETMPFYRAYDAQAVALSATHNITEAGAKDLMKEAYREAEGTELYEVGKAAEEEFHKPVREAEIAERKAAQARTPVPTR